ncbi:MAG: rhamnulokinase [Lachnospiraceae bacterium]|nr:rhamnulokinase [Lachnospiraceae bacterium]
MKYYLAVDIGASSGRHILSWMEHGKIRYEEIHRFANGMDEVNGHKVWDTKRLFREILVGMKKCHDLGKNPVSMGIDTWGVDYVLLDDKDELVANTYAYRDSRTMDMDTAVYERIMEQDLYARTGIQKAIFNTIYQLMAMKVQQPDALELAQTMLMIPDYLNFLLTGVKKQEYTNATTTQLVNPVTNQWDMELIDMLGFPKRLFGELSMPGTVVGSLTKAVQDEVGFNCTVLLPATHDTGAAVMSVPNTTDQVLYLSSGTWSLFGCELMTADCSDAARRANFTNEGGYDYRYRFLKNIMGLWMIQSVKKELKDTYSFAELCKLAEEADIDSVVDANATCFLAPASMIDAVQEACVESGQPVPKTPGEIARVIYRSLAVCYQKAAEELEALTGHQYDTIYVVGGGSNADYLNQLTADMTGKVVLAGPSEATALGNIGAQLIADGVFSELRCFRRAVAESFELKAFHPSLQSML